MGDVTWAHGKTDNAPSSPCLFLKSDEVGVQVNTGEILECTIYRHSQLGTGWTEDRCARLGEIAVDNHSYIDCYGGLAPRENTGVLALNSSGPNGPINQREKIIKRPKEFVTIYIKNLAKLTTDESKFESDQTNH